MELGKLIIQIVVRGDKAVAEILGFEKATEKSAKEIEGHNKRAGMSFANVATSAQKMFYIFNSAKMLLAPLRQMVTEAGEAERSQKKVEQAVISTGGAAGRTTEQLFEMASQLQSITTFDDDQILNEVTAQLLTFTNIAGEQFDRTQQAALDLATVLDGDLQSASIMLGKALNDPVSNLGALGRAGIQFSESQEQTIKQMAKTGEIAQAQTIILDELNRQYGGQAKAAAETGAGAIQQFNNTLGDIKEIGGQVIISFLKPLMDLTKPLLEFLAGMDTGTAKLVIVLGSTIGLLIKLPAILGAVSAALKVLGVSANIAAAPIGIIIGVIGALAAVWTSNLFGIQEKTKTAITYVVAVFKGWWEFLKSIGQRIGDYMGGLGGLIKSALSFDVAGIKENAARMKEAVIGGWDETLANITGKFSDHVENYKATNALKVQNEKETAEQIKQINFDAVQTVGAQQQVQQERTLQQMDAEIKMHQTKEATVVQIEADKNTAVALSNQQFRTVEEQNNQVLVDTMKGSTADFLSSVITGHQGAGKALATVWDSFKKRFIDNVIEMTLSSNELSQTLGDILSFLPGGGFIGGAIKWVGKQFGFAEGGVIDRPGYYYAGENWKKELIVPEQNIHQVIAKMQVKAINSVSGVRGGADFTPLIQRLDKLETAIGNMQFNFYAGEKNLAVAVKSGMRMLANRDF